MFLATTLCGGQEKLKTNNHSRTESKQHQRVYPLVLATFFAAVVSVCWTAKQPPNGPARALFRHRTVQTLPVEPTRYH